MGDQSSTDVVLRAWPDTDHVICEDDEPVDSMLAEREQRLLVGSLYLSWAGPGEGRRFLAMANVGVFETVNVPPIVPDVLIAVDVQPPPNPLLKQWRSYFMEGYGKAPDVVVEIVSLKSVDEDRRKLARYAELGVRYCIFHDPYFQLSREVVRIFRLEGSSYVQQDELWMPDLNLGVALWEGEYEDVLGVYLRWRDAEGRLLLTSEERVAAEEARTNAERGRAEEERRRAEEARARADAEQSRNAELQREIEQLRERLRGLEADRS